MSIFSKSYIIPNCEYCNRSGKYTEQQWSDTSNCEGMCVNLSNGRETFVSFVAPRPGVSRHAVTVTARNARRFVRHGVSITRVGTRSDDCVSLYQSLRPVAILLLPFDYLLLFVLTTPRPPLRSLLPNTRINRPPSILFWASRTCVRCANPCC